MDLGALITTLETDPENGLSHDEAARRLQEWGENKIPEAPRSFWEIYLAPLFNYLITIYLIMSAILVILAFREPSIWPQATLWLSIVIANFLIALVQQKKAQKKLDALRKLISPVAHVIRERIATEIPAEQLVPGDVMELNAGDRISADARMLSCNNCTVNEASLTGESIPVVKDNRPEALGPDTPLFDRRNMVYRGTFVQFGTARALVVRTGAHTELGHLSKELSELSTSEMPLQQKVNQIAKILTIAMGIFLAVQLIVKGWLFSQEGFQLLDQSFIIREIVTSIISAMAVLPINIPLLTTITLLTGVLAMAAHHVLIRDLSAVESLGRISVLCSDKTGTLTRNQMTVKRVWDAGTDQLYAVSGLGYAPSSGVLFPIEKQVTAETPEENVPDSLELSYAGSSLGLLLCTGFLDNNAELIVEEFVEATDISWKAIGDPTEAALLALFNKSGLNKYAIQHKYQFVQEFAFSGELKRMTKVFKNRWAPEFDAFSKGATEVILERCTMVVGSDNGQLRELTSEKKTEIQAFANEFAKLGFRILSLAYKSMSELPPQDENQRAAVESEMTYLGFVCLLDPPRSGTRKAVRDSISAGITPIMITGDSPITAGTIAREVGILRKGQTVHEGAEIAMLSEEEFDRTAVFARVSPQHKQIIVERYQKEDRVVAMTGDGVNDALAVSMADAGIAMGQTGTDVTKEAADLIITDDSFKSIVTGIQEGRSLFQKIRMMVWFYLCVNMAEFMVYFSASLIPGFAILNNWQRAYIFGTIHAFPAFGLIWDRIGHEIMERKPLDTEGILNRKLAKALLLGAFSLAGIISFVYFVTYTGILPVTTYNMEIGFIPTDLQDPSLVTDYLQKWSFLSPETLSPTLDPYAPQNWAQAKARTIFLTTVFIAEATLVLSLRRMDQSFFASLKTASWFFYLMILFMPIIHVLAMYYPVIQYIVMEYVGINVELIRLAWYDWMICVGAGLTPILILELYKWRVRRKGEFF